jgi:hypothetical protein
MDGWTEKEERASELSHPSETSHSSIQHKVPKIVRSLDGCYFLRSLFGIGISVLRPPNQSTRGHLR